MKCPYCGAGNADSRKTCYFCGADLPRMAMPLVMPAKPSRRDESKLKQPAKPRRKLSWLWLTISGLFVILAVLAGAIFIPQFMQASSSNNSDLVIVVNTATQTYTPAPTNTPLPTSTPIILPTLIPTGAATLATTESTENATELATTSASVATPTPVPPSNFSLFYAEKSSNTSSALDAILRMDYQGQSPKELLRQSGLYLADQTSLIGHSYLSPDGAILAVHIDQGSNQVGSELMLLPLDGSPSVRLSSRSMDVGQTAYEGFSPDGNFFVFTELDSSGKRLTIQVMTRQGDLVNSFRDSEFVAFLPNTQKIVMINRGDVSQKVQGISIGDITTGSSTQIFGTIHDGYAMVSQASGNVYFFDQVDDRLLQIPTNGGSAIPVTDLTKSSSKPPSALLSPDGKFIILLESQGTSLYKFRLMDPATKQAISISNSFNQYANSGAAFPVYVNQPAAVFSPDDSYVAYATTASNGMANLTLSKTDGSSSVVVTKQDRPIDFEFTPDGNYLVVLTVSRSVNSPVGSLQLYGFAQKASVELSNSVTSFFLSPDGSQLYYFYLDQSKDVTHLMRVAVSGGTAQDLSATITSPAWFIK
jgi:hypothetical protein